MSKYLVYRPTSGRFQISKIAKNRHNKALIQKCCGGSAQVKWDHDHWSVARMYFRTFVEAMANGLNEGDCEVIVDQNVVSNCDAKCRNAEGDECSCSCMGVNHGGQTWRREWTKVGQEWLEEGKTIRITYRVP